MIYEPDSVEILVNGEDGTCLGCGDPLPVDALTEGIEFCSEECRTDYQKEE